MNWLKNQLPLFVAVALAIFCAYKWYQSNEQVAEIQKIANNPKPDTAHYWEDAYGREHAMLRAEEMSYGAIMALHGHQMDSIAKLLKISAKAIQGFTNETTTTGATLPFQKVDTLWLPAGKNTPNGLKSIRRLFGTYHDNYLDAYAMLGDTNVFHVALPDTIGRVRYIKGGKLYEDITHRNPYVKMTSFTAEEIRVPKGGFSVVIVAGAGYGGSNIQINKPVGFIGLGVAKELFSFGKK